MEVLIAIILIGVLITYSTLMYGYIVFCFWDWFVLPVFPELPEINFIQAVGLYFFISLFKYTSTAKTKDGETLHNLAVGILSPIIVLVVGAIVHSMMY